MREGYIQQVELLMNILPVVMEDRRLALKGGTAINFFYRDAPRLSVDIDLCYLPIEERKISFKNIHKILQEMKIALEKHGFTVRSSHPLDAQSEVKLFVKNNKAEIKVEPNFTLRGSVFDPEIKATSTYIMDTFHKREEVKCLSFPDTFGGKIHAVLDRQHPRDLFDIKHLLDNEGIIEKTRKAFLVYLISSPRPIHEILTPNLKDIPKTAMQEFQGMANTEVTLKDLKNARELLINTIRKTLTTEEKQFLIGLKKLAPNWNLLGLKRTQVLPGVQSLPNIQDLPGVQWKILNLKKMSSRKRNLQCKLLEEKLFK